MYVNEVFVKIKKKKKWGGGRCQVEGGGVSVNVTVK